MQRGEGTGPLLGELRLELKSVGFQIQQSSPPTTNITITTNNNSILTSEHSARRRARGSAKRELTSHSKPEGGSYSQILTPTLQRRKLRFKEKKSFIQERNAAPVSLDATHPHRFLPNPTSPGPRLTWPSGPAPTRAARPPLRAEPTVRLPPPLARRSIKKAPLPPPEARLTRPRPL